MTRSGRAFAQLRDRADHCSERLVDGQRVEITDVLTEHRLTATRSRHGVTSMAADGEEVRDFVLAFQANPNRRATAPASKDLNLPETTCITESGIGCVTTRS